MLSRLLRLLSGPHDKLMSQWFCVHEFHRPEYDTHTRKAHLRCIKGCGYVSAGIEVAAPTDRRLPRVTVLYRNRLRRSA